MQNNKISSALALLLAAVSFAVMGSTSAATQQLRVLHNFGSGSSHDGFTPYNNVIFDAAGNLYGTTDTGGAYGYGVVYELKRSVGGGWTEEVLHSFGNGSDGQTPTGSLVLDASGDLFGTTFVGGADGVGTVFELTPKAGGGWREKVLQNFSRNDLTGIYPAGGLILDASGNLYGTTSDGDGSSGRGTVFEIKLESGGARALKILHTFNGTDGYGPSGSLSFDGAGNLYGTTAQGGIFQAGNAFELKPQPGGYWVEENLHSFKDDGVDGNLPSGGLVLDVSGNLYGSTEAGGPNHTGTIFELTPTSGSEWAETILYSFRANGQFNFGPSPLIFDSAGNLYGTTLSGGAHGVGSIFKLARVPGGGWKEAVLYSFDNSNGGGYYPFASLIMDTSGNFYGTTAYGGPYGGGTVFEFTP